MIEGNEVQLGDRTLVAAPLNFRALERFGEFIASMGSGLQMTQLKTVRELITTSLRRNYSEDEVSDDFIADNLDLRNCKVILTAILSASGGTLVAGSETAGEA